MQTGNIFLASLLGMAALMVAEIVAIPHLDSSTFHSMIYLDMIIFTIAVVGLFVIWDRNRPKLEVTITERSGEVTRSDSRHPELVTSESANQSLNVKAKNNSISKLGAKVRVDRKGPYYFTWGLSIPSSDDLLHANFVEEEEIKLPIWRATKNDKNEVFISLSGLRSFRLTDFTEPEVNIEVQFIGENYTEKKSRRFKLNVKSWDDFGLTKVD